MLPEPAEIEKLARFLCELRGDDPERLEPGNLAFHSSFDYDKYIDAEYEHLFDNDPAYASDGHNGKDKCMFVWRGYVQDAMKIISYFEANTSEEN